MKRTKRGETELVECSPLSSGIRVPFLVPEDLDPLLLPGIACVEVARLLRLVSLPKVLLVPRDRPERLAIRRGLSFARAGDGDEIPGDRACLSGRKLDVGTPLHSESGCREHRLRADRD